VGGQSFVSHRGPAFGWREDKVSWQDSVVDGSVTESFFSPPLDWTQERYEIGIESSWNEIVAGRSVGAARSWMGVGWFSTFVHLGRRLVGPATRDHPQGLGG
jgi:hypothetical protein